MLAGANSSLKSSLPPAVLALQASKRIQCPTCRARVPVGEIAYVDARAAAPQQVGGPAAG